MPHFKHDCMDPTCCRYAGSFDGKDVYQSKSGDVIIRFGDEGQDYTCTAEWCLDIVAHQHSDVKTALEMVRCLT